MRGRLRDRNDDFLKQSSQQFFSVAIRRCGRRPHLAEVYTENTKTLGFLRCDPERLILLALTQLIFCGSQIAQPVLPFLFQPASDKTILRIARFIAPLRALSFIM